MHQSEEPTPHGCEELNERITWTQPRGSGPTGNTSEAVGRLTFGEAITTCREQLQDAPIQPNTKAYRETGLKLVLRSWEDVEALNVRLITSKMVEDWLRRFKVTAQPYVPRGAKDPGDKLNSRNL